MAAEKSSRAEKIKDGEKNEQHTAVLLVAVPDQDHEQFIESVSGHCLFVALLLPAVSSKFW